MSVGNKPQQTGSEANSPNSFTPHHTLIFKRANNSLNG